MFLFLVIQRSVATKNLGNINVDVLEILPPVGRQDDKKGKGRLDDKKRKGRQDDKGKE